MLKPFPYGALMTAVLLSIVVFADTASGTGSEISPNNRNLEIAVWQDTVGPDRTRSRLAVTSVEWEDLGEAAPGETLLTSPVGLPTGEIVGGTIGTDTPYLFRYDQLTSTFRPLLAIPGTGSYVSRLTLGPNSNAYVTTSKTFGQGNLARYEHGSINDLGSIGDEYGEALTVGQDGRVFVATCCQGRLSVYDPQSQAWTYRGTIISSQRRLTGFTTAANGDIYGVSSRIWVPPYGGAVLYKIDPDDLGVTVIGTIWPGEREAWNILTNPLDGRLYGSVGYGMTPRLFTYDPNQPGLGIQDLGEISTGEDQVTLGGMFIAQDGKVHAVTGLEGQLVVYDPANPAAGIVNVGDGYAPLAVGSDQRLYAANGTHLMRSDPIGGFLDLPFQYSQFAQTAIGWTGTNGQGRVNAWFDHQYPTYQNEPNDQHPGIVKYTGDFFATTSQGASWYDGHDGIDFNGRIGSRDVRAAALGTVSSVSSSCNQTCCSGSCCGYTGNSVEIDHGNGYRTIYGHMEYLSIPTTLTVGITVTQGTFLGRIGNTGASCGPHLHFGVKLHSANQWIDVDPFGWIGSTAYPNDPWGAYSGGAPSYYLWKHRLTSGVTFPTDQGATVTDNAGFAVLDIGPSNVGGMVSATLNNTPVPPQNDDSWRSLGRFFAVFLELLLPESPTAGLGSTATMTYTPPITITMPFSQTDIVHFDGPALEIRHWNETEQQWEALSTTIDLQNGTAFAVTDMMGQFDLAAPLICPAERYEPDDTYDAARSIWQNDSPFGRAFDVANDVDWAMFDATGGVTYTIRTQNLAPGVDTFLSVYEDISTGPVLIAANDNYTATLAAGLDWLAPESGTFYLAVTPASESALGCGAAYELLVKTVPGDVTGDCLVDVIDIQRVAEAWLTISGQYGYLSVLDQDDDGQIDIKDIQQVAANWGATCTD